MPAPKVVEIKSKEDLRKRLVELAGEEVTEKLMSVYLDTRKALDIALEDLIGTHMEKALELCQKHETDAKLQDEKALTATDLTMSMLTHDVGCNLLSAAARGAVFSKSTTAEFVAHAIEHFEAERASYQAQAQREMLKELVEAVFSPKEPPPPPPKEAIN